MHGTDYTGDVKANKTTEVARQNQRLTEEESTLTTTEQQKRDQVLFLPRCSGFLVVSGYTGYVFMKKTKQNKTKANTKKRITYHENIKSLCVIAIKQKDSVKSNYWNPFQSTNRLVFENIHIHLQSHN